MDIRAKRVVGSAWAVLSATVAGTVFAQDAQQKEEALEEVVVTGIRASLTKALDIKRESIEVVDAIVAEDIGKFPDNNVVEALQRVTGVQVTDRQSGEIARVFIRGLDDITTTLNGRNIFTSSGLSVALADIPAGLLNRVDVFKTRSADRLETGIAGVIDIHTQRPFNFDGRKMSFSVRGIYQEQADKIDPHVSVLLSDRWEVGEGSFGALVNVSYAETNYRDQSVTAGAMLPFVTGTPPAGFVPFERIFPSYDPVPPNPPKVNERPIWPAGQVLGLSTTPGSTLIMNGQPVEYLLSRDAVFASDFTGKRERPAANLSFQWAPNDSSEYLFETFYNGYRNDSFNSLLFSFVDWWGNLGSNPAANVELYPGTNIVKSRNNVGAPYNFTSGDLTSGKTDSFLYALGGKWNLTDNFNLKSEFAYQTSQFDVSFLAMRADRVTNSVSVDFNSGNGVPAFSFADNPATPNIDESDATDPNQWGMAQLYDNADRDKGNAKTLTLDGDYTTDWGIFQSLDMGVRYDDRTAEESQRRQMAEPCNRALASCQLATYPGLQSVNNGFFDNRSAVPTTWLVPNGPYVQDNADQFRTVYGLATSDQLRLQKTFNVDEVTASAYLQTNFVTEIANRKFDGQFGVRYVDVDTDMTFIDINSPTFDVSTASAKASKLLPSVMLRYGITDDIAVRLSYGQTLRRPAFFNLNPVIDYVEDVTGIGYGTATGGNPNLKPTESKNYDLAVEWYFAESSALTAALFKRQIEGFVVPFRRRVRFEDYDYILTQPDNSSNGELEGIELGFVYFPKGLPSWLDGIGTQASFTAVDSQQDTPVTDDVGNVTGTVQTPLFGVSDTSYSVVLAYEKPKFSTRLSWVWRDDFLNNNEAALFANPLGIYRAPEKSLDFQLNYNVTKNFVVSLEGTNLTEELFQSYYVYPQTNNFGSAIFSRTITVGVRASF